MLLAYHIGALSVVFLHDLDSHANMITLANECRETAAEEEDILYFKKESKSRRKARLITIINGTSLGPLLSPRAPLNFYSSGKFEIGKGTGVLGVREWGSGGGSYGWPYRKG